jgi:N-acetylglucosamine-6-phosphate deacetylase
LRDKGFIICAGHSNASYEETKSALSKGLSGFTHLFNAMSQLGVREPGVVGAALDDKLSWCGVIADGHHVSPVSLRIAYRCKGADKLMLVTDAMPPVGSDLQCFSLLDKPVVLQDGVCRDSEGTLAGSVLDMAQALRNVMLFTGCDLPAASRMASTNPAAFLGLDGETGSIEAGKRADLVVVDEGLEVVDTIIGGNIQQTWDVG